MRGVEYTVCSVLCVVCGVWCLVCNVKCVVYSVQCVVQGWIREQYTSLHCYPNVTHI